VVSFCRDLEKICAEILPRDLLQRTFTEALDCAQRYLSAILWRLFIETLYRDFALRSLRDLAKQSVIDTF